ncbi:MAG TPA: hypothetical protein VK629_03160 [Steroidobacteraceae bacterium]|nr:hypothetical protein [Steroidobacteraceae bacterium]
MKRSGLAAVATTEQALVQEMNRRCQCAGTDVAALHAWLDADLKQRGHDEPIVGTHPHLFSELPVFISNTHASQMGCAIAAIESVIQLPAYQEAALARAPTIARHARPARGVFLGYDFHLTDDGPKLIEINTNAGGALLNVAMMRAQQACCVEVADHLRRHADATALEESLFGMFMTEWHRSREGVGARSLPECIGIVDDAPGGQYLYPEFLLFRQLFESRGVHAVIASASQLRYARGALWFGEQRIDMIYNRLTDFYLAQSEHAVLAQAYADDAAVLTPHPHGHALYANKHNLSLLSDEHELTAMGVDPNVQETLLQTVPHTMAVSSKTGEQWWQDRKQWFFKPASGFGSRGTYRGDKITRRAFADVLQGDYIAQQCVPPGERWIGSGSDERALKFDVRNYVYAGDIQLMTARLYQGQTTNFRTQGGGFAPIYRMNQGATECATRGECGGSESPC